MSNFNEAEIAATAQIESLYSKIEAVAKSATQDDRAAFDQMKAKSHTVGTEIIQMTPGLAALIFTETNSRNRDWRAGRSEQLAEQMKRGEWMLNGQGLQFYPDFRLADGQHRTSACALSGVTIDVSVFYGLRKEAIPTVDGGTRRNAADAMKLDGVNDAGLIEQLVKAANAYEIKAKVEGVRKLVSTIEILNECTRDVERVRRAIAMGELSTKGVSSPCLNAKEAAKIAYVLIKNGWDERTVSERLAFFQVGQDESESSPLFQVSKIINKAKASKSHADRVASNSMIGLMIKAFQLSEEGVRAVQSSKLTPIRIGKEIPNPRHA
jgi:hypothetical protein